MECGEKDYLYTHIQYNINNIINLGFAGVQTMRRWPGRTSRAHPLLISLNSRDISASRVSEKELMFGNHIQAADLIKTDYFATGLEIASKLCVVSARLYTCI